MNEKIQFALLALLALTLISTTAAIAADAKPDPAVPATQQAAPRATKPKAPSKPSTRTTAPSFKCAKASNAVERAVCADPALAELDVRVAAAYKKALSLHVDKTALRENQRQWLRQMHGQCADAPVSCARQYYKARLSQLVQHNEQAARAR
jgi:uncharacterized protein YecT (DUF1311 family)